MAVATRLLNATDTSANWAVNNPLLKVGEIAWSSDTKNMKVGNGVDNWASLTYLSTGSGGGSIGSASLVSLLGGYVTSNTLSAILVNRPTSNSISAMIVAGIGDRPTSNSISTQIVTALGTYITSNSVSIALATYVTSNSFSAFRASLTLASLVNVTISATLSTGQVLKWDGAKWTNDTDLTGGGGGSVGSASLISLLGGYVTSNSMSARLLTYVTSSSLLTALGPYLTSASANLGTYITSGSLATALAPYLTSASAALSTYITSGSLATALAPYLTSASAALSTYITSGSLATALTPYLTSASAAGVYITSNSVSIMIGDRPTSNSVSTQITSRLTTYMTSGSLLTALTPYLTSASAAGVYVTSASVSAMIDGATIDRLANVVITTPSSGDFLQYNGTNWVNAASSPGGGESSASISQQIARTPGLYKLLHSENMTAGVVYAISATASLTGHLIFDLCLFNQYADPGTTLTRFGYRINLYSDGGTTPFLAADMLTESTTVTTQVSMMVRIVGNNSTKVWMQNVTGSGYGPGVGAPTNVMFTATTSTNPLVINCIRVHPMGNAATTSWTTGHAVLFGITG